eukprot:753650-Hanusia_phi.AAC.3
MSEESAVNEALGEGGRRKENARNGKVQGGRNSEEASKGGWYLEACVVGVGVESTGQTGCLSQQSPPPPPPPTCTPAPQSSQSSPPDTQCRARQSRLLQ